MHHSTLILLITACTATAQSQGPATFEFDLVFPRNETYAPTALMPVVFAFRNSPAWIPLIPILRWDIRILPSGEFVDSGTIDLAWGINATTDPYILAFSSLALNAADGNYSVVWDLVYGNCTATAGAQFGGPDQTGLFRNQTFNNTNFAIRKGAQSADLAAESSCPARQGFALNVTATRTVDDIAAWEQRNVCGVVADPRPVPSPCALKFDAAAASSVNAALTSTYCSSHANNTGVCPPSATSTNVGARGLMDPGAALWILFFGVLLGCMSVSLW